MKTSFRAWLASALLLVGSIVCAQTEPAAYKPPDGIVHRWAFIISEGTRMTAEIFTLKSNEEKVLPTIIMCHGWGGVAAMLRPDALVFARAGYFVLAFDYRGWGASDGRLVLTKPAQRGKRGEPFVAEVKEVREIVDPLDQTTDLLNAIHWVHGEKQCDKKRIGLWGSSYAGGHVVYAAARDPRVKAIVSQVPGMDSRFVMFGAGKNQTLQDATRRTRGEIGYPEPGIKAVGNLVGAPIRERLMNYAPVEDADKAPACAMLFILAEKEELMNNKDHGVKAYERARGPKKLITIPKISHYGIYREARPEAQRLAVEWFDLHLKAPESRDPAKR
jgi:pimeloyl-ACP methyl ester carboxylesterase